MRKAVAIHPKYLAAWVLLGQTLAVSEHLPQAHLLLAQIYGVKHDYAHAADQSRSYLSVFRRLLTARS